jgi:hypothetical protein
MVVIAAVGAVVVLTGMVAGVAWLTGSAPPPVADFFAPAQEPTPVQVTASEEAVVDPVLVASGAVAIVDEPLAVAPAAHPEPKPVPQPVAQAAEPAPAVQPQAPPPPVVKRLRNRSAEDLRRMIVKTPEVSLEAGTTVNGRVVVNGRQTTTGELWGLANKMQQFGQSLTPIPTLLANRSDLSGLPYRMGEECHLGKESAENMQAMSRKLRSIMAESMGKNGAGDNRLNADHIKAKLEEAANKEFATSGAVPCLMQMLQPESTQVRQVLVGQLGKIKHRSASESLARLALYDVSDEIREEAIAELAKRPAHEYRPVLLGGFRYIWAPVAEHAAEALVALDDQGAASALRLLANEPDPSIPVYDKQQNAWMVTELVRINHLSNCMLCHAPSQATTDLVRGRVPSPNQPLPPMTQYYEDTRGIFVRADTTYLKQDFSVYQPVEKHGQWPLMQRFDYLVRTRKVETQAELAGKLPKSPSITYPQRDAVLYALQELTR